MLRFLAPIVDVSPRCGSPHAHDVCRFGAEASTCSAPPAVHLECEYRAPDAPTRKEIP